MWRKLELTEGKMEDGIYRRLHTLSRHLSLQPEPNQTLHLNYLSAFDELQTLGSEAVVIGGMVLDINATPSTTAHPRTTTPGKVQYVTGGVARNIAECMSKLGTKPFMISTIGLDMAGNLLLEYWKSGGLAIEGIQQRQDVGTPVVCNVFDSNGELSAAVASVEAIENFLTLEWIQQFRCKICSAPVLMIDANLNASVLEASCKIAAESGIPVWFEPVSVVKSKKITSIVKYVTFTSPNEDELVAMANALSLGNGFSPLKNIENGKNKRSIKHLFEMLKSAILVLLEKGVKIVIVTLGADGIFVCSKDGFDFSNHLKNTKPSSFGRRLHDIIALSCPSDKFIKGRKFSGGSHLYAVHFPSLPASVLRLTGAGDCLVGGSLASFCTGLDVMQSMAVGIAAAKAAVEVKTNVPFGYPLATVAEDASKIYSLAKVVSNQPV